MRFVWVLMLLPGMAHALKCKPSARLMQPGAQIAANGFQVLSSAMWSAGDDLKAAHFVDAAGKKTPVQLETTGQQVLIRAQAPLAGTVTLSGMPQGPLAAPTATAVAPKVLTPTWTGAVKLVDETSRLMGRYGRTWSMTFAAPAEGTTMVQLATKSPNGEAVVRYLPIQDGTVRIGQGACSGTFGGALPPGKHAAELRLVALDGTASAPKAISLNVLDRRP